MNKKRIRYCINTLISIAESQTCKDLHHKKSHQHELGDTCPAEDDLRKIIAEAQNYVDIELK